MEGLFNGLKKQGTSLYDDPSCRRPQPSQRAFEDLGSTFGKRSDSDMIYVKQKTIKPTKKKADDGALRDLTDSESEDELDWLSQKSENDAGSPVKTKEKEKEKPLLSQPHTSTILKNLKFRKNSGPNAKPSISSSSNLPISKVNGTVLDEVYGQDSAENDNLFNSQHDHEAEWEAALTGPLREKSPNRRDSPSRSEKGSQSRKSPGSKSRLRPRLVGKMKKQHASPGPASTSGLASDCNSNPRIRKDLSKMQSVFGPSKAKKGNVTIKKPSVTTLKKPQFGAQEGFSMSDSDSPSPSSKLRRKKTSNKSQPQAFPVISPTSSPVSNDPPHKTAEKPKIQAFPILSPPDLDATIKNTRKYRDRTQTQESDKKGKSKAKGRNKMGRKTKIITDEDVSDTDTTTSRPQAQPFPMSTQILDSIGSPSTPIASVLKRALDGRKDGIRKRKKICDDIFHSPEHDSDYLEEDTIVLSPSIDPRTLCPYCDTPLPASPTPLLTRLIAMTAKKSQPDPRPSNPLGRKAPLTAFVSLCQRHRFESKILPEAEERGWPKTINWPKLEGRIERMCHALKAILDDPQDQTENELKQSDGTQAQMRERGPRSRCVFWAEVMNEVRKKGTRAVASVRAQFATFEKTQPGYYGELGSVIIHQTLFNLFPPSTIKARLVAPLTPAEFIQRIMVPEVAVRLIMEDQKLDGDEGAQKALQVLRDSSSYGVAMFPEDGGEWGGGHASGSSSKLSEENLGFGDLIVMERARKRRKELEEEEERERAEGLLMEQEKHANRNQKTNRKGKEKQFESEQEAMMEKLPKPRIKPRPLTASSSAVDLELIDIDLNRQKEFSVDDSEADIEVMNAEPMGNSKESRHEVLEPKRRITRSVSRSSGIDINLCSSGSDAMNTDDNDDRNIKRAKKRGKRTRRESSEIELDDIVQIDSKTVSSKAPQDHPMSELNPIEIDEEPTPKPIRTQPSHSKLAPLEIARQRRVAKTQAETSRSGRQRPKTSTTSDGTFWSHSLMATIDSDDSTQGTPMHETVLGHSWLLSDESQPSP